MIKRLAMTIALAGLSGSALAADLRGPIVDIPPPPPLRAAGFGWTGGYVGVNVGVGTASPEYSYDVATAGQPGGSGTNTYSCPNAFYNSDGSVSCQSPYSYPATPGVAASGRERLRSGGVLGGVQAGYNYAFGGFGGFGSFGGFGTPGFGIGAVPVIGVEADFDGSGISSGAALGDFASGNLTGTSTFVGVHSDIRYFGTVRGRLGVAFDRLLVFGTGGFAYGQVDSTLSSPTNGVYNRSSNFHTGYAYGGGVEYAITNNLLLRAEYLHIDLNRKGIAVDAYNPCTCIGYSVYEKPSLDLVRAGLDYKFDFARAAVPVVARY